MSFTSEVKNEVALKTMEGNDGRAELSALIQLSSSLSITSEGMSLLVTVENAAVARTIIRLVKDRYTAEINLFVKKRMNLKKNNIYGIRIKTDVMNILEDIGLYGSSGVLDKPLMKILKTENNIRAYLAGAFLSSGSISSPEKPNYHLEITAANLRHAELLISLLARFEIKAKMIERRNKYVVYVKQAEKIGDFLRVIDADEALLNFENHRIERDFTNQFTRLNNIEVANEVKVQQAASLVLKDIQILEEGDKVRFLDQKLQDVVALRKAYPEASLKELTELYRQQTGNEMTKSGMKHRFVKLHELAMKETGGSA